MHSLSIKYKKGTDENDLWHAFNQLLGNLRHNGQLIGLEWQAYKQNGKMYATVFTATKNALDTKYQNKYVKTGIKNLQELCGYTLQINWVGITEEEETGICNCKKRNYFLLRYYNQFSPVICGSCNKAIPLFKIPKLHDFGYWNLTSWQSNYIACVILDVNCAVGEKWAIKQQCNADSELSKQGRAVANSIYKTTGVKTYYYLSNFSKRSKLKDTNRPCPGCGGEWRLKEEIHDYVWFKCNKCLLMSSYARP